MTGWQQDSARRDDEVFRGILLRLGVAVFERVNGQGAFHLRGARPTWWNRCFGSCESDTITVDQCPPFLKDYLMGSHSTWQGDAATVERSGAWTESDGQGGTITLEATTLTVGSTQILLVEQLGTHFQQMQDIVQRARERMLAEDAAVKSHRKTETRLTDQLKTSEQIKDDALALLQHLDLAALVLDEADRITFASRRSLTILGVEEEAMIGRGWEETLPLDQAGSLAVREILGRAEYPRKPISCRLTGRRAGWIDVDVHPDPRQVGRHIMILQDSTAVHDLRRLLEGQATFHDLVGKSPAMQRIYQLVRDVAKVDTTVLIEGETGTGKELIARAIHSSSTRKLKPFIAANCAGLTDSILTSQLFGHKRGAFTGAIHDQQGLFEAAEGGTLFLDEIGDIPPPVQTALLRVLQEKEITRLGETRPRKVNVRVVAATHHNLSEDVVRGTFRADLLYRIRIARIQLPPLRDRREDIPLLADALLSQICTATGKAVECLAPETFHRLMSYSWPGNVRELKSAIEFAVISCKGNELSPADLPPEITQPSVVPQPSAFIPLTGQDEKTRLLNALSQAKGNRTEAARRLGVSRATFYRRLVELEIPLH